MSGAAPPVRLPIAELADVAMARKVLREVATRHGLPHVMTEAMATALSEVASNILVHAGRGEVAIGAALVAGRAGLEVIARDGGPGIADPTRALEDGYSTRGGLGIGLSGARRLVDEFSLESEPGRGTTVTLRKWVAAP